MFAFLHAYCCRIYRKACDDENLDCMASADILVVAGSLEEALTAREEESPSSCVLSMFSSIRY